MSASGSSSTAQRSKQSDNYNKQPKADKRKKVEEEQETHEQQEDGDSSAAQRKKSKQRVKEESKEAEHEEEEAAEEHEEEGDGEKSHEDAPSKPKLVVKKTSEGDEYIDVRQHSSSTTGSTHAQLPGAPYPLVTELHSVCCLVSTVVVQASNRGSSVPWQPASGHTRDVREVR